MAQVSEETQRNQKIVSTEFTIENAASDLSSSSVAMLNYLPIVGQGAQLIAEILFSGFSDYFGTRLPFLLLHSVSTSGNTIYVI